MQKDLFKNYIFPIAVFSGGIIGVGFLSLPYVAMKVGIWVMLIYFVLLTAMVVSINLIFSEISLKTPDYKRFPGFAKYYLGKWGGIIALICTIAGSMGSLLVFLIVGGGFLSNVFMPLMGGNAIIYTFIYFLAASIIVFCGIKMIAKAEFWILVFLFLSLFFVLIEGFSQIKLSNIFIVNPDFKILDLFFPYGPILFALWAMGLIPEVEEMIIGKKKLLKKIIAISTIMVSALYFLFVLLVLGISGSQTTEIALTGLSGFLGHNLLVMSLLAGTLATFTAFITQGIILKKVLMYDLGIKHWQAFIMTCFTPLILFLLGFNSFIFILSILGGFLFGISGIMVLMMYKKIGGKNIIIYPLSLVFLLGIIYEIIYFIK
jgi:amino acid permease